MLRKVAILAAIAWPAAANAEPPRVIAVVEQAADSALAARVTEAAESATGELTSFSVREASPEHVHSLGRRARANLVLVVTPRDVRVWDMEVGAFLAARVAPGAPREQIRRLMARSARAVGARQEGTRTWVTIAVAGAAAAVFVAAVALRLGSDQDAPQGLTLRFVAP